MRQAFFILISLVLALGACKKKNDTLNVETPGPAPVEDNSAFKCKDLPPGPMPFGWHDSTTNVDHNINTFMFNPVNADEVIVVVNGDVFGYNKMYCYNIPQAKALYLATVDHFPPSINRQGWIVFNTIDNDIFKIKASGDSLTRVTSGNTTRDPHWDYTGNNILYFQMPHQNVPAQLIRANAKGITLNSLPAYLPHFAAFNKSNKVIYQRLKDNSIILVLHDIVNLQETTLISGPYTSSDNMHFDNLCLDNNDEYFYWSNTAGIFRCSLGQLKTDTVLKNCPSVEYMNPVFQSSRPTELLMGAHFTRPINAIDLLHEYKAIEFDMATGVKSVLDLFPENP